MTKAEILEFIKRNPVFYLATSENNIPHVRTMTICNADEDGIIFNTKRFKDSYIQLENNPNIEMCFYSAKEGLQIRISGIVSTEKEIELQKEIVRKFPILKPLIEKNGYDIIIPYRLKTWEAKVWDRNKDHYKEIMNNK